MKSQDILTKKYHKANKFFLLKKVRLHIIQNDLSKLIKSAQTLFPNKAHFDINRGGTQFNPVQIPFYPLQPKRAVYSTFHTGCFRYLEKSPLFTDLPSPPHLTSPHLPGASLALHPFAQLSQATLADLPVVLGPCESSLAAQEAHFWTPFLCLYLQHEGLSATMFFSKCGQTNTGQSEP